MLPFQCDVASEKEVEGLVEFAVSEFGAIHHCFNGAGIEGARGPLHEATGESFARVMAVNAGGIFHCMAKQIGQMLKQQAAEEPREFDESPYAPKAIDHAD